jgi:UDP-N-acetylmuramate dehydrogenase
VRSSVPESTVGPSLGAVDPSLVKTSAAWLIERAGFTKGFGVAGEHSPARLSTRHTLALTNRGGATAQDVVTLARAVRDGVRDRFGVELEPEPVLVGLAL